MTRILRAAACLAAVGVLAALAPTGTAMAQAEPPAAAPGAPPSPASSASSDAPGPMALFATVEPEEVQLGGTVTLKIDARYPAGTELRFPNKPFVGKGFRFRSLTRVRTSEADAAEVTETLTAELVAVRLGRQRVAAIELAWVAGEQGGTVKTPAMRVRIKSNLAAEISPALRGAGEPLPLYHENTPLIWSLIILGVAALAALITLVSVRVLGPRLRGALPPPPPRPAHEIAYERLGELKQHGYPESGEFKAFYLELSGIVREYFGNRYDIGALGDTTTELMDALHVVRPKGVALEEIETFLDESDLVKFAKWTPTRNDMENALVHAQLFVDRTREEARERREEKVPKGPEYPPAPLPKRLFGFMLDLALIGVVYTLILVAGKRTGADWAVWLAAGLAAVLVVLRDLPRYGSIGKRVAGLRLTDAADGSPPTPVAARIARNLLLALPVAGVVAEAVWAQGDPERRRIGDRWAHTRVEDLKERQGTALAWIGAVACAAVIVFLSYVLPTFLMGA